MKIRLAVLLLAFLLPLKAADALPIFDIGATPSTIANAITDAGRAGTNVKKAKTLWETLNKIGKAIKSVADFFSKAKKWIKKKHDIYVKYRDSVRNFIRRTEDFYASVMNAYEATLDAIEYMSEIGKRIEAYAKEGKEIVQFGHEALQRCQKILTSGADKIKALKEQRKQQTEQEKEAREKTAQLEKELAELESQGQGNMSEEDRQRLRELQAKLDEYRNYGPGTAQGYADELSKLNQQLYDLRQQKDEVRDDWSKSNEIEREIQKVEAQIVVMQEKYRAASNEEYRQNVIRQLEEEEAHLQHHTESNSVTNWVRDKRDQLAIQRAKAETYKQYLRNIENQIFNYNRQVVDMVNDCKYRIQMTVARTKRLICNMTTGALSQYAGKIDSITGEINNASSALDGMSDEVDNISSISDCERIKEECTTRCSKGASDDCEDNRQASCQAYQENCMQVNEASSLGIPSLAAGVPQCETVMQGIKYYVTKFVDCTFLKAQCEADEDAEKREQGCEMYEAGCTAGKDGDNNGGRDCYQLERDCEEARSRDVESLQYGDPTECNIYKTQCSTTSAYSTTRYKIHNSSQLAQADLDVKDEIPQTSTDTPQGVFVLPVSLKMGCELKENDELPDCISRYNAVKYAIAESDIPEDMIEFYKALRGVKMADGKTPDSFMAKHQALDAQHANRHLGDAYAEYLASAYFTGLNFYKKYFLYDVDVVNPIQNSYASDVGVTWASISLAEQEIGNLINDIYTMWAKEQMVKAVDGMVNHQIPREEMQDAKQNDVSKTGGSDE